MSMYFAVALLGYAGLTGVLADRLLARARWAVRLPVLALRAWHACALAFLSAVACASAVLAHDLWEHLMVRLFHADEPRVHAAYAGSGEIAEWWNGTLGILLLLGAALTVTGIRQILRLRRARAAHRLRADTLAQLRGLDAVYVLQTPMPAAYCVPGGRGKARVVVTSGAVELLSEAELGATVEHERAHLRYRHHRGILWADVVASAVGKLGLLCNYSDQVRRLSEMAADDRAAVRSGPRLVAAALLAMCTIAPSPGDSAILTMAGSRASERIHRLLQPPAVPARRPIRLLTLGTAAALIILPLVLVVSPGAALSGTHHQCRASCAG